MSKRTIVPSKREIFEAVYKNLTSLQNSYQHMLQECCRQLWSAEAVIDTKAKDDLQKNIQVAKDASVRLERLKYYCALVILTEGSALTEEEVSKTIDEIVYLLGVAELEIQSSDEDIRSWASSKMEHLAGAKDILLQVLSHKIDGHIKRGLALWQ